MGDDAFGVEVAQRLAARHLPAGVKVRDIGIRGLDLAYALLDGPDHTILIDALPRGEPPGTITVLEPDLAGLDGPAGQAALPDAHDMNPLNVLRVARSMGASLRQVLVVGCEPATLGPEEGLMGLSEPVAAAVPRAVTLVESLIDRLLQKAGAAAAPAFSPQP
jgi:hydrogenase maturation protease